MGKRRQLDGKIFGRLTVISYQGRSKDGRRSLWACRCSCGTLKIVWGEKLTSHRTQSCGCLRTEVLKKLKTTHGHSKKKQRSYYYNSWMNLKQRCTNHNNTSYKNYGRRNIIVHKAWQTSFSSFFTYLKTHLGLRPSPNHSLDRINNNKGYIPGNLRWSNKTTQNFNCQSSSSRGVRKEGKKFRAIISYQYKKYHLGMFATKKQATAAYKAAALKFHGFIPN